ncbi:hypothetical protein DPMN_129811 [Dreissena polymorpha]|uniref:Uncharacterized protein n=1 Tax=Dreissena polymorpha TaxID=45954 RepID=A0A9D4K1B4_DREPO|nr:hypothetical protein DPMN_129811 [Dreissena polymorpha]
MKHDSFRWTTHGTITRHTLNNSGSDVTVNCPVSWSAYKSCPDNSGIIATVLIGFDQQCLITGFKRVY